MEPENSPNPLPFGLYVQSGLWIAAMGLFLLWPAGDWAWPQAWAFLILFIAGSIGFCLWLARRDPALLASRLGPLAQRGQPLWDRLFLIGAICVWYGWLAGMGLDARRWHLSHMPVGLNILGGGLVIAGLFATARVLRENTFAAPVVRVQTERHQHVIDTGPYAWVRHPMYASALVYLAGMPLLLGSWYGLAVLPLIILGLGRRAVAEERLLERELPFYAAYMGRVRYRLIPGLW